MKVYDATECMCVAYVALQGGAVDADDPGLDKWTDDRPRTDTINRLFDKGALSQVMTSDDTATIILGP
jgi:predicted metal-dependent phosphotriesterase family hydrolase